MTLRGPGEKSLLHEIARVRLVPAEREAKTIERRIKFLHQLLEIDFLHGRKSNDARMRRRVETPVPALSVLQLV